MFLLSLCKCISLHQASGFNLILKVDEKMVSPGVWKTFPQHEYKLKRYSTSVIMAKKDIFLILFPLINIIPILVMNVCVTFSLIARLMFNVLTSQCIILDNLPLFPPIMSFFIPVQWMIVSPSPLLLIWSPPAPRPGHRGILWYIYRNKIKRQFYLGCMKDLICLRFSTDSTSSFC